MEIKAENASTWYNRACLYSLTSKKDEALADLNRAVEFDPFNIEMAKKDKKFERMWKGCGKIQISGK